MSHVVTTQKLELTERYSAITRDGIAVPIIARGPGVSRRERRRAERNHRRWCAGLRPNRFGIWR